MTKEQDAMITLRIEKEWMAEIEEYRKSLRNSAGFLPRAVVIRMLLAKGLASVQNGDDSFGIISSQKEPV
jgi:hypothetical protein